jgi:hypothetical protein
MAIAYKSQGAGVATETSGAALSPLCPVTVDAGDILIAHVFWEGTATAPSTPANWTLLDGPRVIETTIARMWVFGKIADGTEDNAAVAFGNPAVTTQRGARVYSFSGRVGGSITNLVNGFAFLSHATDPQMPTVQTTMVGARAVALVAQNDNNTLGDATGETGGNWVEAVAEFVAALTPGLVMQIQTCIPTADPGTVSGGAVAATNDPSGVIAFQILPDNITGSGTPDAQAADITGAGLSTSLSTDGAIAAQAADVTGVGKSESLSTDGAIAAQASQIDGVGLVEAAGDITGTGALTAQAADITGAGVSSSSGSGSPDAQAAQVDGEGKSTSLSTDGAIAAQAADVTGAGKSESLSTDGAIAAQAAQLDGEGFVGTPPATGTGALLAGACQIHGVGEVTGEVAQPEASGGGGLKTSFTFNPRNPQELLRTFNAFATVDACVVLAVVPMATAAATIRVPVETTRLEIETPLSDSRLSLVSYQLSAAEMFLRVPSSDARHSIRARTFPVELDARGFERFFAERVDPTEEEMTALHALVTMLDD